MSALTPVDANARRAGGGTTTKVVPSRYAAPAKASSLPSVRSQLEQQKAAAEAARTAEASAAASLEALKRSASVTRATLLSELQTADDDLSGATASTLASSELVHALRNQIETLRSESSARHRQVEELQLRVEELETAGLDAHARVVRLESQLAEAHDAVASARDVELPMAARQTEALRVRAERAEAHTARLHRQLAARASSLRELSGHLTTLQRAIAPDDGATLEGLSQQALATFGTLYAEKQLHTDGRFAELQDVLVRLCMKAGELGRWLPWWLANRHAELGARVEELRSDEGQSADSGALALLGGTAARQACADLSETSEAEGVIGLSPELASGGRRPRSRLPFLDAIFDGVDV